MLRTDTDFQNITLLHPECFTAIITAEMFYPANISYSILLTDNNKAHLMNCKLAGLVVTIWDQSENLADIDWSCLLSELLYLLNANIKFLENPLRTTIIPINVIDI